MMLAVVTIAHGRHDHLALQQAGLRRSHRPPDLHVVVAMDDGGLEQALEPVPWRRRVVHLARSGPHLPLARARNVGARTAITAGAGTLVFLDVDCVPSPTLLGAYDEAATDPVTSRDLLCGPVSYLPPPPPDGYDLATLDSLAEPHAARPAPPAGTVDRTRRGYELFWSLSFALGRGTWSEIGGFHEGYLGYGGEDTDFAKSAESLDLALTWVGAATAFHQHHPVSSPPVEHVEDVVRNATLFHARWGQWPMTGWLSAFEERGLVERRGDGTYRVVR
ncbi:glycosyltransferase family 2 protein [Aeromicrobium yanjiei]|uniref:Glycosyltransferase family 2 protein n=2 Tax=Aeromicrobium yanjiei TaxID=2662028 RepID=A0A5Q2MRE0_9ACTN|nr:glycosyltransferase family 2 protein [Aeromicrobium yanjiei]